MFFKNLSFLTIIVMASANVGIAQSHNNSQPFGEDETISPITPMPPLTHSAFTTSIEMESRITRNGDTATISMSGLALELREVRHGIVKKWSSNLLHSQSYWFFAGNLTEGLSQLCQVATPILAGCAAGFQNESFALASMVVGSCGIGLGRFSVYAHNESIERGSAANEFLNAEGVASIPIIKSPPST